VLDVDKVLLEGDDWHGQRERPTRSLSSIHPCADVVFAAAAAQAVHEQQGRVAIACQGSELSIWDLETQQRCYLAKGAKPNGLGATACKSRAGPTPRPDVTRTTRSRRGS
jgi:hypothetical protein